MFVQNLVSLVKYFFAGLDVCIRFLFKKIYIYNFWFINIFVLEFNWGTLVFWDITVAITYIYLALQHKQITTNLSIYKQIYIFFNLWNLGKTCNSKKIYLKIMMQLIFTIIFFKHKKRKKILLVTQRESSRLPRNNIGGQKKIKFDINDRRFRVLIPKVFFQSFMWNVWCTQIHFQDLIFKVDFRNKIVMLYVMLSLHCFMFIQVFDVISKKAWCSFFVVHC